MQTAFIGFFCLSADCQRVVVYQISSIVTKNPVA